MHRELDIDGEDGEGVTGAQARKVNMLPRCVVGSPANMIAVGVGDGIPGQNAIAEAHVARASQSLELDRDADNLIVIGGRGRDSGAGLGYLECRQAAPKAVAIGLGVQGGEGAHLHGDIDIEGQGGEAVTGADS